MPGSEPWLQTVPRAASQPSSCANRVLWLATGRPESAPEVMQIATYRGSCGAHLKVFWKKVRYSQAQQFKGRRCGEDDETKPGRKVDTADVVRDSRAPENRGRHKHEAD